MTVHFATGDSLFKAPPHANYAMLMDQKSNGTDGGGFSSGAWRVRDLNTEYFDPDGIVTLSNNIFVLVAGNYFIRFSCPAYRVNRHQAVLFRESGTQTIFAYGSSERSSSGNAVCTRSEGVWRGNISGTVNLQIRHQCQSTYSNSGFGIASDFTDEIYTIVEIFKEA